MSALPVLMRQNCNTHLLIQQRPQLQEAEAGVAGRLAQGSQGSLAPLQDPQAQGKQLRQLLVTLSPMLCVTMKVRVQCMPVAWNDVLHFGCIGCILDAFMAQTRAVVRTEVVVRHNVPPVAVQLKCLCHDGADSVLLQQPM